MEPKYRYSALSHYSPPIEYDWVFESQVKEGWKLVSVVKEGKEKFISYWEKPYND